MFGCTRFRLCVSADSHDDLYTIAPSRQNPPAALAWLQAATDVQARYTLVIANLVGHVYFPSM